MAAFALCPACRREYEDPRDRRFHAEPTACPVCGPRLTLCDPAGRPLEGDPVAGAAALLRGGGILALKGLGGFHLACDAADSEAVARLRRRKAREEKPLAVMVPDLAAARALARVTEAEAELLGAAARPIVLLALRPGAPLAPEVAPGLNELGVMLPYTPLHHLLLAQCGRALVMTSGNLSEEPIAFGNAEALERLAGIADAFLLHDREIHMRCDDSVARVWEGAPRLLRRSRGYAPAPLTLPWAFTRPLLATGGELKNTFCLGRERFAFLSHHIGDLENESTLRSFERAVEHYGRLFQVTPEVIVHDLHPDYLSTRYALERAGQVELIGVQHHHAHVAAVMAEHGLEGPVLGIAWDGAGYGTDGTLWGGEVLLCDLAQFTRVGTWRPFRLPGGAAAIRQPWRTALSLLLQGQGAGLPLDLVRRHGDALATIRRMVERGFNAPLSSGVGRLFDAAAALILGRDEAHYEGQAAIALEHAADPDELGTLPVAIAEEAGVWVADSAGLAHTLAEALLAGTAAPILAARFHNALAQVAADMTHVLAARHGVRDVVLSGGVFQNRLLLRRCADALARAGLKTYLGRQVPVNDGGLALGQAVIGGRRTCA
jgi:hydrogenase maturation protein HypF